jgi:hypothetical protein
MKLGVVIQGPLVTYGQGPNNSNIGFVTLNTILENIAKLQKLELCYIVSTWLPSSQQELDIISSLKNFNVNILQNSIPQLFDPDHRYKQHFGISRGANVLLENYSDITHLVKIRTDMLMPDSFWEWVCVVSDNDNNKLYVSELMNRTFYQGDFIYLGTREVFLRFLNNVISSGNVIVHPCIALDMGVKNCYSWGYLNVCGYGKFRRISFLIDFILRSSKLRKKWNLFIAKHIGTLPESIWVAIKWRDRSIGSFLNSSSFKFDSAPIINDVNVIGNLQGLITDFKIYFIKCIRKYLK